VSDNNLPKTVETDELTKIEDEIRLLKYTQNHSILAIGKHLERVFVSKQWMSHGYDTYNQWVADPNGVDIRPRTARLYRLLWRVWEKKLAKIGVSEPEILAIDHCKLAYVARRLKQETEPNNLLQIIHEAKTLTLRQLQDNQEEQGYQVHEFDANCHKIFNEKAGKTWHLSAGKERLDISAQSLWEIFGNRRVKVKIMLKKEMDNDEQP
jgi:hypothetical protein